VSLAQHEVAGGLIDQLGGVLDPLPRLLSKPKTIRAARSGSAGRLASRARQRRSLPAAKRTPSNDAIDAQPGPEAFSSSWLAKTLRIMK